MAWKTKKDEMGQRYGRLVVISDLETGKGGHAMWLCRCDCGNETDAAGVDLRSGNVRSCGCLQKEIVGELGRSHVGLYARRRKRAECIRALFTTGLYPQGPPKEKRK